MIKFFKQNQNIIIASGFLSPIFFCLLLSCNYIYFNDTNIISLILILTFLGLIVGTMIVYLYTNRRNTTRIILVAWLLLSLSLIFYYPIHDTRYIQSISEFLLELAIIINYYILGMFATFQTIRALIKFQTAVKHSIRKIGLWVEIHPRTSPTIVTSIIAGASTIIVAIIGAIVTFITFIN